MNSIGAIVPMEDLKRGQQASVYDVSGDPQTVHRLAEMGLRTGCQIQMRDAGEPMRLMVEGKELMLRCGQSVLILVSVQNES